MKLTEASDWQKVSSEAVRDEAFTLLFSTRVIYCCMTSTLKCFMGMTSSLIYFSKSYAVWTPQQSLCVSCPLCFRQVVKSIRDAVARFLTFTVCFYMWTALRSVVSLNLRLFTAICAWNINGDLTDFSPDDVKLTVMSPARLINHDYHLKLIAHWVWNLCLKFPHCVSHMYTLPPIFPFVNKFGLGLIFAFFTSISSILTGA